MQDYFDRRKPTEMLCPKCLEKGRHSVVMKQPWGDLVRLTCSDFSSCSYSEESDLKYLGDLDSPERK